MFLIIAILFTNESTNASLARDARDQTWYLMPVNPTLRALHQLLGHKPLAKKGKAKNICSTIEELGKTQHL